MCYNRCSQRARLESLTAAEKSRKERGGLSTLPTPSRRGGQKEGRRLLFYEPKLKFPKIFSSASELRVLRCGPQTPGGSGKYCMGTQSNVVFHVLVLVVDVLIGRSPAKKAPPFICSRIL